MEADNSILEYTKMLLLAKYPMFGAEIATANLKYNSNLKCHTAATDGKDIFFDPEYIKSLSDEEKIFLIAHELMHIKFQHMYRMKDKSGQDRDQKVWNIATDAIINANLEKDGFTIKEGYVNIPQAINFSSEQLYDILYEEKKSKQNSSDSSQNSKSRSNQSNDNQGSPQHNNSQGVNSSGQNSNPEQNDLRDNPVSKTNDNQDNSQPNNTSQDNISTSSNGDPNQSDSSDNPTSNPNGSQGNNQSSDSQGNDSQDSNQQDNGIPSDIFDRKYSDDHSLWGAEREKDQVSDKNDSFLDKFLEENEPEETADDKECTEIDEKLIFDDNRSARIEKAKKLMNDKRRASGEIAEKKRFVFDNIDLDSSTLDWRDYLRRKIDKEETKWSQRRGIAENNYAYRLEDLEDEEGYETEVMIDTSGSVSLKMVKGFLRQLKPLLRDSRLKVGCFDTEFYGFKEIRSDRDIAHFEVEGRGGTNLDLLVRSFSKGNNSNMINKIIFTDGEVSSREMPAQDLKNEDVIWLVYKNVRFNPCCGTVIQISRDEIDRMLKLENNFSISKDTEFTM